MKFFHSSDTEIDIGTVMRPDRERYAKRWWRAGDATNIFRRLEETRPDGCRSHGDAIFMMSSLDDLIWQGFGYRRYTYEVIPLCTNGSVSAADVERHDLRWIECPYRHDASLTEEEACAGYWTGRAQETDDKAAWEYLAPAARVVRLHAEIRGSRHFIVPEWLEGIEAEFERATRKAERREKLRSGCGHGRWS